MSSNYVQTSLMPESISPIAVPQKKKGGFGTGCQPMRYHDEQMCQATGCSNIVPAGDFPAQQKRFVCSKACKSYCNRQESKKRKANGTAYKMKQHYRPAGNCEGPSCNEIVPAGPVNAKQEHYFCSDDCNRNYYNAIAKSRRAAGIVSQERKVTPRRFCAEGPCDGPGCENVVPASYVLGWKKYRVCSEACRLEIGQQLHIVGVCEWDGKEIRGPKSKMGKQKHCDRVCEALHEAERTLGATGPFRQMIEEYLATSDYGKNTLPGVKVSLCHFFGFAVEEGLTKFNQIKSPTFKRFIAGERARGITSGVAVGHLSTFFSELEDDGVIERSPVIRGRYSKNWVLHTRQPYLDKEMSVLEKKIEKSGNLLLMLAFVIGEGCGPRISEVCNIRLSDIDLEAQTIYIRLPTKNKSPRTVPFGNKVKKYLEMWLQQRDPRCQHDHLLHNTLLDPMVAGILRNWFHDALGTESEPAASFEFHRLRHTWATRLVNADMELAVLMVLGGWKSLKSVQIYAKVRQDTVDRQYQAACAKIEKKHETVEEEAVSWLDFASMEDETPATPTDSAA